MIDLKLCYIGQEPGLISALKQEGIAFSARKGLGDGELKSVATVYLGKKISAHEKDILKGHLTNRGAVVFDRMNKDLRFHLAGERIKGEGLLILEDIEAYKSHNGYLIYINKDLNKIFLHTGSLKKEFITAAGAVRERVAFYSKSFARELLSRGLLLAQQLRQYPFARLWYYPDGYLSLFNFRFDLDEDTDGGLNKLKSDSSDYRDCTSWFVCCASFKNNRDKIKDLAEEGFDIQSHGYYHHTYGDRGQNLNNIKRSLEYLRGINDNIEGFVAPLGRWNRGLQQTLQELSFLYSSEFSLDYDNLPFYPVISGSFSTVLQIPIHPVCLGLYLASEIRDEEIIRRYFDSVIFKKYNLNQPIILYGHPNHSLGKSSQLQADIYKRVTSLSGLWRVRLSDLARWWNKRDKIEFDELSFDPEKKTISYSIKEGIDFSHAGLCIDVGSNGRIFYQLSGRADMVEVSQGQPGAKSSGLGAAATLYYERPYPLWERLFNRVTHT